MLEKLEKELEEKKVEKVLECCNNYILYKMKRDKRQSCKLKYCPICSIRKRHRKREEVYKRLKIYENIYFITLNGKRVEKEEIHQEKKQIRTKYKTIQNLKEMKKIIGTAQKVEISFEDNKYKPHLHIIGVTEGKTKLKTKELSEELEKKWQKINRLGEENTTHIRKLKNRKDLENITGYLTVKREKQFLNLTEEEIEGVLELLKGKNREYVYTGVLRKKEVRK